MALAFAVGFAGTFAALAETGQARAWVAAAVLVTTVASLTVDAFGGIVVGLAAAAALIVAKRVAGGWEADAFAISLLETVVLVLAGGTAGAAGRALRDRADGDGAPGSVLAPAFGSMGLLPHDLARLRLEEEVERALAHRRPLTVLVLESTVIDDRLDAAARGAAHRSVARILESRLGERDVPFAVTGRRLGAILPETGGMDGWVRVGQILDAVASAAFTSRATGARMAVADAVEVDVGLAELGRGISSADALLDAATAGMADAPADPEHEQAQA